MRLLFTLLSTALFSGLAPGQSLNCDLKEYKPLDGLKAEVRGDALTLEWRGDRNEQLRAIFSIREGQPLVRELAARKNGGSWVTLGRELTPEFDVTSGRRRLSQQQAQPMRKLNIDLTPEVIDREKWKAFWDAPLNIPGNPTGALDMPRKAEEIRHATATYRATGCQVKTDGARVEVTFPGLEMGIFSGRLQYTIYRGTNLLRQEAIAKTEEPSVAYKYVAGLKGFPVNDKTRVAWRDVARAWQTYEFGGAVNTDPVALRARNRLAMVETADGSLAVFPPSHKFFFAREIELNLGYVWYRKDSENSFSVGVRQADHEEEYRPYGVSNEVWERRQRQSRNNLHNFALYNAPPGTWQRMPVYFYLSPNDSRATQQAVMAFTHDDVYKPMPGFKVLTSHFHFHFNEQLTDAGSMDYQPSWLQVFRALGINIAILADFHSDSHPKDPGPLRYAEQKVYFDGCERFSDRNFLAIPGEEPNAYVTNQIGHYITVMSHPVYWAQVREAGHQVMESDPKYGKVYRIGSVEDEMEMLQREGGLVWQAHPRTKGSSGFPDAIRETKQFRSDLFLGGSYQSLPVDQSEKRICESRCLGLFDEMNNWGGPKYMLAEGDTYQKYPDDETYPQLIINYVKMDRVPRFKDGWNQLVRTLRAGDYFVTSGEVLLRNWGIEGIGPKRTYAAEIEWTWPLEFVELVWGDGDRTDRQIISATDLPPLGSHRFRIPFDTAGKKWVRFAVWDSAGNGALTQPVHLR